MKQIEIEIKLREILKECLMDKNLIIEDDSDLRNDLGLDSMGAVDMAIRIEAEYNTSIPDEDIKKLITFNDVIKYIIDDIELKS